MKIRLSLIQTCSGKNPRKNLESCSSMIDRAMEFSPQIISLPEIVNLMDLRSETSSEIFLEKEDFSLRAYQELAKKHKVTIHVGSLSLISENNAAKRINRSFWIDPFGKILARYDKIHLFDVRLDSREFYRESDRYESGDRACLIETEFGKIGLSICYDLRFPYLYRSLAQAGALMLFVPAAFTEKTGKKHWHSLLRARAIECRAYVIAAAQGGKHEDGRSTFGHSLVVSPDGEILAEIDHHRPACLHCEIDTDFAETCRSQIPSLQSSDFTLETFPQP